MYSHVQRGNKARITRKEKESIDIMEKLMKVLLVFWGIVLMSIALKFLASYLPNEIDFSLSSYFNTDSTSESPKTTEDDKNIIFPLEKQYGLTLEGYKGCTKNYSSGEFEKGFNISTNSLCSNDECSISVAFEKAIPKTIKLYVEINNDCHLKEFIIPQNPDIVGYYVNLQLSESQKEYLQIKSGDKIRLENSNGYSLHGDTQLYFYSIKMDEDNILVNDIMIGKVFFNKNSISTNSSKKVELDIPHPKKLYTFNCDNHMQCTKEANTYIVNVDGVDFIPSKAFILTCLKRKDTNKFCTYFIPKGHAESMKFDSISMMHSYINMTKNPEFNDDLKAWEQKRLKKAKQKIEESL